MRLCVVVVGVDAAVTASDLPVVYFHPFGRFVNRDDIDFGLAQDLPAVQTLEMVRDSGGIEVRKYLGCGDSFARLALRVAEYQKLIALTGESLVWIHPHLAVSLSAIVSRLCFTFYFPVPIPLTFVENATLFTRQTI